MTGFAGFGGAFSPVIQGTDAGTCGFSNHDLPGLISGHNAVLLIQVPGATVTGHNSPVGCNTLA